MFLPLFFPLYFQYLVTLEQIGIKNGFQRVPRCDNSPPLSCSPPHLKITPHVAYYWHPSKQTVVVLFNENCMFL